MPRLPATVVGKGSPARTVRNPNTIRVASYGGRKGGSASARFFSTGREGERDNQGPDASSSAESAFSDSSFDSRDEQRDESRFDNAEDLTNYLLKYSFPEEVHGIVEILCKTKLDEIKAHFGSRSVTLHNDTFDQYCEELKELAENAIESMDAKEYTALILNQIPKEGRALVEYVCKDDLSALFNLKAICAQYGVDFNNTELVKQQSGDEENKSAVERVYLIAKNLESKLEQANDIPLSKAKEYIPSLRQEFAEYIRDIPSPISSHKHPFPDAVLCVFRKTAPEIAGFLDKSFDFVTGTLLKSQMEKIGAFADKTFEAVLLSNCSYVNENGDEMVKPGPFFKNLINENNKDLAIILTLLLVVLLVSALEDSISCHYKKGVQLSEEAMKKLEEHFSGDLALLQELQKSLAEQTKEISDLKENIANNNNSKHTHVISKEYIKWNESWGNYLYSSTMGYPIAQYCNDYHKIDGANNKQKIADIEFKVSEVQTKYKDPIKHLQEEIDKIDAKQKPLSEQMVDKIKKLEETSKKFEGVKKELKEREEQVDNLITGIPSF